MLVPEILEGTLNSRVAPRRIFRGRAQHELSNLAKNTGTTAWPPCIRPLARHQLPVPSQQRVRRDDRRDLTQGVPPQPASAYCESPPIVIGEPQAPPTDLPPEEAILFDQIGERLPLPAIEPTDDGEEQQPKNRHVDHERELISRTRQRCPNPVDPELGHYGLLEPIGYVPPAKYEARYYERAPAA